MSFSDLRDIFSGRFDTNYCVKAVLFLKSPSNARFYLANIQKVTFPYEVKRAKWEQYALPKGCQQVNPISDNDLANTEFMTSTAGKLSFDISRFIEFISAYNRVADEIKPMMLHYGLIYLFDFFSRSWLKYEENHGHGLKLGSHKVNNSPSNGEPSVLDTQIRFEKNGIFPRTVDAFYLLGQSSIFSLNEAKGMQRRIFADDDLDPINKYKYSTEPKFELSQLMDIYEECSKLSAIVVNKSNFILVGFSILFTLSSICRYKAKDWFSILGNRDLNAKLELLQHDFIYDWIPELLMQTILSYELRGFLPISKE